MHVTHKRTQNMQLIKQSFETKLNCQLKQRLQTQQKFIKFFNTFWSEIEIYSESSQTSKMDLSMKIVND